MRNPSKEDVETLLMLIQTFNTHQYPDLLKWFIRGFSAKDYADFKTKYPQGGTEWGHLEDVLGYYEFAGVLVSHGLLNENLFFDAINIDVIWNKIGPVVPGW